MQRTKRTSKRGFTLIELLVVVVIIGILATIGMVSYTRAMASARDNKRRSDMENVRQALVMHRSELGGYPCGVDFENMLFQLQTANYWSGAIPEDPRSPDQDYSYTSACSGLWGSVFELQYDLENPPAGSPNPQQVLSP